MDKHDIKYEIELKKVMISLYMKDIEKVKCECIHYAMGPEQIKAGIKIAADGTYHQPHCRKIQSK